MHYTFHRFETVGSTNDLAAAMADDGAPEGTVVVADEQVSGRGRHGRTWVSSPGDGLYLSMILRPKVEADRLWQLAFVTSVAAAEAVRHVPGLDARTKWPNDVLVNGRKVSGILIEARRTSAIRSAVIVGVGINVNTLEFPPEIRATATSLTAELGGPVSRSDLEDSFLDAFGRGYAWFLAGEFSAVLEKWRRLDCTVGRDVDVRTPDGAVVGTAVDVKANGNLLVRRSDGSVAEITAGEVLFPAV